MLQEGGLYPGPAAARAAAPVRRRTTTTPSRPSALLDLVGLRDTRAHAGAPAVGRAGAAAVARVRARSAGPRSCSSTSRPRAWTRTRARPRGSSCATCATAASTVLLTTHAMDEAEQLCDRVAIIAGGRLAALGSPAGADAARGGDEIWFAADAGPRRRRARDGARPRRRRRRRGRGRASTSCAPPGRPRASPTSRASCATATSRSPRCRPGGVRSKRSSSRSPPKRGAADERRASAVAAQIARRARCCSCGGARTCIVTLAIPLGILVFFAKVDTRSRPTSPTRSTSSSRACSSLAVMAAAMVSLGIATGFERRYGVLKRLGSTPLSRGGLLAAKTATVLAVRGRAGRC